MKTFGSMSALNKFIVDDRNVNLLKFLLIIGGQLTKEKIEHGLELSVGDIMGFSGINGQAVYGFLRNFI